MKLHSSQLSSAPAPKRLCHESCVLGYFVEPGPMKVGCQGFLEVCSRSSGWASELTVLRGGFASVHCLPEVTPFIGQVLTRVNGRGLAAAPGGPTET